MIKKVILGIILAGILVVPVFGRDCEESCSDDNAKCCNGTSVGYTTDSAKCRTENKFTCKMMVMCGTEPSNPLDAAAREFIESDVERIAILPFSDYSSISPVKSESQTYWASRRIHDFMTEEFLKMGKLVVPYDTMIAALSEIRGEKSSELTGMAFLQSQMADLSLSSASQQTVSEIIMKSPQGRGMATNVTSLDLTSAEIVMLGQALNVDAVFMGSISDYGTQEHIKADARTFIPPFLGIWNPSKKSMIRMLVYLYEVEGGELIWSSMEETSYEPTFPLLSSDNRNYEKLNRDLAENIVNHFRDVIVDMKMYQHRIKPSPTGGPGDVRREKDIRVIMKKE